MGGSLPIDRDKMRRPVTIALPGATRILGVRILQQNANDGMDITLKSDAPPTLQVTWNYMDPGAGVKFAVVMTGDSLGRPVITGYLDGKIVDTDIPAFERHWGRAAALVAASSLIVFMGMSVAGRLPKPYSTGASLLIVLLFIGIMIWAELENFRYSASPF